jgi:SAM-dependent methyltransferase
MMKFAAHNIELPGGEQTLPGRPLLADEPLCRAVMRTLRVLFPDAGRVRPRIADLGALEGGYAVEFARAGYDVVAVEGRASNVERCAHVADRLRLPNLGVVHDDARNVERHGPFDAIFCCGLLYHLDAPAAFLRTCGKTTRRALLVDTHYATEPQRGRWPLSGITVHEGHRGRWFTEWAEGTPAEEQDAWSAVGNARSFWLERTHLLEAIRQAGFDAVYEQYDRLTHMVEDDWIQRWSRSLFVGVKAPPG